MKMKEEQRNRIKEQIRKLKKVPGGFYAERLKDVEPEDIRVRQILKSCPLPGRGISERHIPWVF